MVGFDGRANHPPGVERVAPARGDDFLGSGKKAIERVVSDGEHCVDWRGVCVFRDSILFLGGDGKEVLDCCV